MEAIIGLIGLGMLVPLVGWIAKTLYDMNAKLESQISADSEKWNRNDEKWEHNESDHVKAFGKIAETRSEIEDIKKNQGEMKTQLQVIDGKVDVLVANQEKK